MKEYSNDHTVFGHAKVDRPSSEDFLDDNNSSDCAGGNSCKLTDLKSMARQNVQNAVSKIQNAGKDPNKNAFIVDGYEISTVVVSCLVQLTTTTLSGGERHWSAW